MQFSKIDQGNPRGGISTEWLSGKEGDARTEYEAYLRNSKLLFDQLRKMIQHRYNARAAVNETDYDCPSWAHKQAHKNGYLNALEEIAQLLP